MWKYMVFKYAILKPKGKIRPMNRVDVTYSLITNKSKSKVLMVKNIDHSNWSRAEIIGGNEEIVRPKEISEIAWIDIEKADELMPY